jgi:cutinase
MGKGVADVIQRLNSQSKACPDEKFALVGYSQGAAVMHGVGAKLDDELMKKVLAIVLYGDGARSMAKWPVPLQSKIYENCAKGDMVSGLANTNRQE